MINSLRRHCFPLQCKRCKQYDIRRSLLLLHIDGNNNCGTCTTISISVCQHRNIEISRQYCRDQRRRLPTFSETFDKVSASFFRQGYAQLPTHTTPVAQVVIVRGGVPVLVMLLSRESKLIIFPSLERNVLHRAFAWNIKSTRRKAVLTTRYTLQTTQF